MENYLQPWNKYADFSGRASRSEFWTFMLVNHLLIYPIIISLPLGYEVSAIIFVLFWMVALLPSVAVTVRRLQDTGNSGWVILFKPVSTMILVLVKGNSGHNKYGPDPYGDPEEPNIEDHFIA